MDPLTKLYVEVTSHCNLSCQMCIQRVWETPQGHLPLATFRRLMDDLAAFPEPPIIHLGGYGEPTYHPDFLELVRLAKATGARVELTTNGTLLSGQLADALIDLKLDRLVVSIDGVSEDSYNGLRVDSDLQLVIANLRELYRRKLTFGHRHSPPHVEIAFVATKRNVADLPRLPGLATRLGAWNARVSNVIPHTAAMEEEILYEDALTACAYRASRWVVDVSLPKLDFDEHTLPALEGLWDSRASMTLLEHSLSARNNYCPFAQEGYAVVRRDGRVSPCLALLYSHPEYIRGRRKDVTEYAVGDLNTASLPEIWESAEYVQFRQRVRDFQFSPCTTCGGCERFPANQIDCIENTFPTCGGCLWAQGIVTCP